MGIGARAELTLPTLDGTELTLASLRGTVTLLDFWATWCAPCRESFPFYAELQARYESRGFAVVAVSVDDDRQAVEGFVERELPPFRVALDTAHDVVRTFAPEGMPASYLIDRNGVVRFVHIGFAPDDREVVEAEVRALLDEEATDAQGVPNAASP